MGIVKSLVPPLLEKNTVFPKIGVGLPNRANLIAYYRGTTDTIGVSVEDYDRLNTEQQAAFFTNPTTPVIFPGFADFWAVASTLSDFNIGTVMGTLTKGVAIYADGTDRSILNRALVYFGLPLVYSYFMEDSELWPEDGDLWPED